MKYVDKRDNQLVVTIGDIFINETAIEVLEELEETMVETGIADVVFDFNSTKFIDSSGAGTLVDLRKSLEAREGNLILRNVNNRCMEIFESSDLENDFTFERY